MHGPGRMMRIIMLRKRVDARRARSARGGGISSCRAGTWTRTSWSSTVMPRAVALRQRVSCMKRQASTSATVSTGTPAAHPVLRLSHPCCVRAARRALRLFVPVVLLLCGAQGGVFLLERKETCFSWSARRRVSPGAQGGVCLLPGFLPASYPLITITITPTTSTAVVPLLPALPCVTGGPRSGGRQRARGAATSGMA